LKCFGKADALDLKETREDSQWTAASLSASSEPYFWMVLYIILSLGTYYYHLNLKTLAFLHEGKSRLKTTMTVLFKYSMPTMQKISSKWKTVLVLEGLCLQGVCTELAKNTGTGILVHFQINHYSQFFAEVSFCSCFSFLLTAQKYLVPSNEQYYFTSVSRLTLDIKPTFQSYNFSILKEDILK